MPRQVSCLIEMIQPKSTGGAINNNITRNPVDAAFPSLWPFTATGIPGDVARCPLRRFFGRTSYAGFIYPCDFIGDVQNIFYSPTAPPWLAICICSMINFASFMNALGSRQVIEAQWQTVMLSHKERERL